MQITEGVNANQNTFDDELNNKIVINETILLKKIQLIRKYYAEAKKAFVFFNSQSFDTKPIEKEIFELFFSTKFYQGTQSIQFGGFDYIIYESNFKFIYKKNKSRNEKVMNSDSNVFQLSKESQGEEGNRFETHEYHYFGQVLNTKTSESVENVGSNQVQRQEQQDFILHGFGLLINFGTKETKLNPSQGYPINCYFGQFINGLRHGEGMEFKQSLNNKDFMEVYLGNFVNGNYDDDEAIWLNIKLTEKQQQEEQQNVTLTLEYIDKYFGGFVNGKKHGKGKISSIQLFYDGDWRFDKPQGMGQIWTSTSYYKGRFKSGLKHRNGKEWFKNGDVYEGSYSNNKPSGQGKYLWKNGSFYEGEFKNGLRDGKGLWKSGPQSYEGNYLNDKKSGEGIYYWNDGQTYYKGTFYQDLRHGYGQMFWDNRKSAYKGKWKQGFQDGYGEVFQIQSSQNLLKLIKKGQFFKGNMVEQIVQQNQTSIQPSPKKKSQTSDSDQFKAKQFSSEKSEQFLRGPNIVKKSINKPVKLRKPSLIKGIKQQPNHSDQIDQDQQKQLGQNMQIKTYGKPNQRKRFVKSQNQNYNQFLNKQEALKHIHAKQRYLMDAQKNPIEKQHLYGSVYLIKSGRKRLGSSVQNTSRAHNQDIQHKSDYKLPNPSKANQTKFNKNNRSSSYSNTQPVSKLTQERTKNQRLQQIHSKGQLPRPFGQSINKKGKLHENQLGLKQPINLPKGDTSNQGKYAKLRYFDPEDQKNFSELEPLIVWNNFSKNTKRSFLK